MTEVVAAAGSDGLRRGPAPMSGSGDFEPSGADQELDRGSQLCHLGWWRWVRKASWRGRSCESPGQSLCIRMDPQPIRTHPASQPRPGGRRRARIQRSADEGCPQPVPRGHVPGEWGASVLGMAGAACTLGSVRGPCALITDADRVLLFTFPGDDSGTLAQLDQYAEPVYRAPMCRAGVAARTFDP